MARNPAGSPKARNLGAELRESRERSGVSLRALAQRADISRNMLARYESGRSVPNNEQVAALLATLGIHGDERERIVALARDVDAGNWVTSGVPGIRQELTTLIEFERTASDIVDVAPMLIPGLLQTSDYMRAVMANVSPQDAETRIMMRLSRRDILTRRKGPRFTAFISEGALREPIGGRDVMADQLRHIEKTAELTNVAVQVIPTGAEAMHPAHVGPFMLFRFDKADPIVHVEHYSAAAILYGTKDVTAFGQAVERLRPVAMDPTESVDLIAKIASELEGKAPRG